jgi:hypothetical protein
MYWYSPIRSSKRARRPAADSRVPLAASQELAIHWHGDDKGNPQ